MSTEVRIWIGTLIGGLVVAGFGVFDAAVQHAATLGAAGDATFILGGASLIAGKAIFDQGVQVPTPPK